MPDQDSVEERKAASAAGAADNSGLGVDGDDPSTVDASTDSVDPAADSGSTDD
ncbi:hypothetical protein [Nakamurella deserti]|uniref:hypothetical protein n=1 Tax=Nakamurella deserti TaxID=2164074 RepID=UPI00130034AF|nr:hypothetical protein [Nakamurella deserti]